MHTCIHDEQYSETSMYMPTKMQPHKKINGEDKK